MDLPRSSHFFDNERGGLKLRLEARNKIFSCTFTLFIYYYHAK